MSHNKMQLERIYCLGGEELSKFLENNKEMANGFVGNLEPEGYYLESNKLDTNSRIWLEKEGYEKVSIKEFIKYLKKIHKEAKPTKIILESKMTSEQLDAFISEIERVSEIIGIKLNVKSE